MVNLSGKSITTEELAVLDKGLKHAPVKNLNTFNTYRDTKLCKKNMSNHFKPQNRLLNDQTLSQHSTLRNNSVYNPQVTNNQHIEVFKKISFTRSGISETQNNIGPDTYEERYKIINRKE